MNKLLPILLLVFVVVVSGCVSTPPNSNNLSSEDKCFRLDQSQCESTAGCEPNFVDSCGVAGDCGIWRYHGCFPAEADPENLCDGVKCTDGQACFEGGCISTASEKVSLNVEGYRESCTDEPRLFVEKEGKRIEVKNYLWDKAPIYVNSEYKEFPTWCDLLVCQNISKYPIDVELMSYELIGTKKGTPEYTTVPIKEPVIVELNYFKTEEDCNNKVNAQKFSKVYNSESDEEYCSQFSAEECQTGSIDSQAFQEPAKCKLGPSCPVCEDIKCHANDYDKDWSATQPIRDQAS